MIDVLLMNINEIVRKFFGNGLDLVSIDVEGPDEE